MVNNRMWRLLVLLSIAAGSWSHILHEGTDLFCKDLATKPQPRKEPWNVKFAKKLAREVREADAGQGYELIFYGDSITEQWRGTDQSRECYRCDGDPELFKKYFGQYRADILAVGGDQVAHLLWRLIHGDIPVIHKPKLVVVMIGTNDLGAIDVCSSGNRSEIAHSAGGVIQRLGFTIELLQDRLPDTQILMLGILPRGSGFQPETMYIWPGTFTPAIEAINAWLALQASARPGVMYLDCGPDLLIQGKLTPEMFQDGLHPTHKGMDAMSQCVSRVVDKFMDSKRAGGLNDLEFERIKQAERSNKFHLNR